MTNQPAGRVSNEPMSVADLRLPPTFVTDHGVRTLFYQGAMSAVEMAKHWRVHPEVAAEVVDSLKAAGLVDVESGQATFERMGRVRLNQTGQTYAATARSRTWYAGPLPVSLDQFESKLRAPSGPMTDPASIAQALGGFGLDQSEVTEIGQAVASGGAVALRGAAYDEQRDMAAALGGALTGTIELPYSLFSAGSVVRVVDSRMHRRVESATSDDESVLRTHDVDTQWLRVGRPLVTLTGGLLSSDVVPAYDQEAKFYLAPRPFAACGGVLAVLDAEANPDALCDLARLWLIPGRQGVGIMVLRSGERIELPWHAATVLFNASEQFAGVLRDAVSYTIDISDLPADAVAHFVERRFPEGESRTAAMHAVVRMLEQQPITRAMAATACRYLRDRALFEGTAFSLTPAVVEEAARFAGISGRRISRAA
jgi:DNA-binding MarR family transcriptional regulator